MKILFELSIAMALTVVALPTVRKLQLISYLPQRGYIKIFASLYYWVLFAIAMVCLACYVCGLSWVSYGIAISTALLGLIFLKIYKKPPLRFTVRAIRLVGVTFAVLLIACLLLPSFAVMLALPLLVLVAWLIILPFEGCIYCYYFNKARKKLSKLQQNGLKVVAITGSYAKTSVKLILSQLLHNSVATPDSCNTPMGISAFINKNSIGVHDKYFIAELGARKKGDIKRLCKLVNPDASILTGIAPQHLKTFGTINNIKKEKAMLIQLTKANGCAVLNGYDENVLDAVTHFPNNTFVVGRDITYKLDSCSVDGNCLTYYDAKNAYHIKTALLGYAHALNVCIALAMCQCLGESIDLAIEKCSTLRQIPHRMDVIKSHSVTVIDDGYNANIKGIECCCQTLDMMDNYKIVIAQGLVECGKSTVQLNRQAGQLLGKSCDVVIAVGVNQQNIFYGAKKFCKIVLRADNIQQAVNLAQKYYQQNTVVLFQNDIPV